MYAKNFSSETSLSMSSCVDVQLIYRSFVLNFLSARRELTSKHTIAYDISNQHHNNICYVSSQIRPSGVQFGL